MIPFIWIIDRFKTDIFFIIKYTCVEISFHFLKRKIELPYHRTPGDAGGMQAWPKGNRHIPESMVHNLILELAVRQDDCYFRMILPYPECLHRRSR